MRVSLQIGALGFAVLFTGLSLTCMAKNHADAQSAEDQNMAVIVGEAGERYPIFGAGGIKVSGGHHGMWMSNMKQSAIQIDGSDIGGGSSKAFAPFNENSDFSATGNCAHFVNGKCVCILPTPVGIAGQEIVVINSGPGTSITYRTANGEPMFDGVDSNPSTSYANTRQGRVDKFISDGKAWYLE